MSTSSLQFYVPSEAYYSRLLHLLDRLGIGQHVDMQADLGMVDRSRPWIICVPVKSLDALDDPKLLELDLMPLFADPKCILLLDLSIEAVTFEGFSGEKLLGLHRHLEKAGLATKRTLFVNANAKSAATYPAWAQAHGITNLITVAGYHFYLFEYYWEICLSNWMRDHAGDMIAAAQRTVEQRQIRPYHYMSLNLRPRSHRTAIMLHLLESGHLPLGRVSYFGEAFGSTDAASVATLAQTRAFVEQLPSGPRLLPLWDKLHAMCPIAFERDDAQMRKDLWHRRPGEVEFLIPEAKQTPPLSSFETYFEIVNETWLTDERTSYITEKTLRAILRLQPFIHVGSPGILAELRAMGFETFAPFIDESYDAIHDPAVRIEAIFREIDRLCALTSEDLHTFYLNLWPRLEHNFEHLLHLNSIAHSHLEQLFSSVTSELPRPKPPSLRSRLLGRLAPGSPSRPFRPKPVPLFERL